jgi:hypothetical protein
MQIAICRVLYLPRALFRNLVDIVIDEFLDSIKDGNFLTICQIDCILMSLVYTE